MRKLSLTSILSQLLLLLFVIIWIIPTFGLFISSLRDKDLLSISGWWTSLTTTEINEIHRMLGMEHQIQENNYYIIKGSIFEAGLFAFCIADRNAAKSTTQGTPVKSCNNTLAGI